MSRTSLKIDGMSCSHCVAAVKKAIDGLNGVTADDVTVGSATVTYDPSVVSLEKIRSAVNDAGYTVAHTS